MCENPGICTYFRLLRHPADHLVSKKGRFCSRNRTGVQDRILVFAGDGELYVIDVEKVPIDPGNRLLVDEVGAMDSEEVGIEDGFPLRDGCLVPEAAVAGRDDGGDVVVGFDVQDFFQRERHRLPVRCERDGRRPGGALPVQPGFEVIAACCQSGQDNGDENGIRQDVGNVRPVPDSAG